MSKIEDILDRLSGVLDDYCSLASATEITYAESVEMELINYLKERRLLKK